MTSTGRYPETKSIFNRSQDNFKTEDYIKLFRPQELWLSSMMGELGRALPECTMCGYHHTSIELFTCDKHIELRTICTFQRDMQGRHVTMDSYGRRVCGPTKFKSLKPIKKGSKLYTRIVANSQLIQAIANGGFTSRSLTAFLRILSESTRLAASSNSSVLPGRAQENASS